jgi:acyl carrier protein
MSSSHADVKGQLRAFVERTFLYLHPDVELEDDADLLTLGVIDSLGFVELVEEVQSRFGIEVSDHEITEENFGSIDGIARFVDRKAA